MKKIVIKAQKATPALMDDMEKRGLLRRIIPSKECLSVPEGEQVVERIEIAGKDTGPWQMLAVACNRVKLDHLAAHGDIESWLYFSSELATKPLLYVVASCGSNVFEKKAADGSLTAEDIIALEVRPNNAGTSYFTVPGGIYHDELTYSGTGAGPVFFVPEPSEMSHKSISLNEYEIIITPA